MEILNLKDYNTSFLIPLKNGHRVIYRTLVFIFKQLNVNIEIVDDISKSFEKTLDKKIIFTRNPLDRFFSSYSWMEHILGHGDKFEQNKVKKFLEETNIDSLSSFIENYPSFIEICDDFHYLPQSSQILHYERSFNKNEIIDFKTDLDVLYKERFKKNYEFYKIEDINSTILYNDNLLNMGEIRTSDKMRQYSFLSDFTPDYSFLFSTFYTHFNLRFQKNHHLRFNYKDKISDAEYEQVCVYTKKESDFFKYNFVSCDIFRNL